jgi:D-tyrosyl-tRNA(Tyr) deacylase
MKSVVQRVSVASIIIDGEAGGKIEKGLLVLSAFSDDDTEATVSYCVDKILNLRIFPDADGKLNLSVLDVSGEVMLVSNFTVYGDTSKGRRPSFAKSARPEISEPLYRLAVKKFCEAVNTVTGKFGADMQVSLTNDGPVTVIVEK